ncbi:MAG: potassium transporter TrkG [Rikenellaceae bacterium]
MRSATVIRYVGMVVLLNAAFMFLSALVALFNGVDTSFFPLLMSFIITSVVGLFPLIFVPKESHLVAKEGYAVVVGSWIMSFLAGMLPYLIWGGEFTLINAWFETVSGYTTTGSTILTDIEALPKGLLFWRSCTHWIGGVGVVLFALVLLPSVGRTKMKISNFEISEMAKDNFRFTTRKLLKVIVSVYAGLTFVETILLWMAGMSFFDAITHSFSTIATGGLSTRNASIAHWDSLTIEMIVMVFMLLAGTHLGLLYSTIVGRRKNIFRSDVWRFLMVSISVSILFVSINLYTTDIYDSFWDALRYGAFQVVSFVSTTGFASADASAWPPFSVLLLIFLSMQCAMSGSTTGGLKVDRVVALYKAIRARVLKIQHPNAVIRVKLHGTTMENDVINFAVLFVAVYLLIMFVSTMVMALYGYDLLTSFTVSVATLGNVGPGFGLVNNMANFSFFPEGAKLWLTFVMLLGRLEIFGLLHIFLIRSWK